jgi:hypothetical protein
MGVETFPLLWLVYKKHSEKFKCAPSPLCSRFTTQKQPEKLRGQLADDRFPLDDHHTHTRHHRQPATKRGAGGGMSQSNRTAVVVGRELCSRKFNFDSLVQPQQALEAAGREWRRDSCGSAYC